MAKGKEVTNTPKIRHGTAEWFQMVGTLMSEAASQAGLSPELNLSFVERYTDGAEWPDGLVQGIRFDIVQGEPSFRIGARKDERADITVAVTAAAARALNLLRIADAKFLATLNRALNTGEMQVDGDLSIMGKWIEAVHDPIVDRTE